MKRKNIVLFSSFLLCFSLAVSTSLAFAIPPTTLNNDDIRVADVVGNYDDALVLPEPFIELRDVETGLPLSIDEGSVALNRIAINQVGDRVTAVYQVSIKGPAPELSLSRESAVANGNPHSIVVAKPSNAFKQNLRRVNSAWKGGSIGYGTGQITATYDLRTYNGNRQVKLTNVSGYWSPNAVVDVFGREVGYIQSYSNVHKYPTANSYSYSTGFGWTTIIPNTSVSGQRVYSAAKFSVSGNQSGTWLEISFDYTS